MNLQQHKNFDEPQRKTAKVAKKSPGRKDEPNLKLSRKDYEKKLEKLQIELCYLQDWVRETGARVAIVCEGRDTAGKGGLIRRMTERVSPRTFRVVALSAPSQHERQKLFLQRYVEHLPAAGEVVIFDRSWYNRAGVERVMKYTPKEDVEKFLENAPKFERWLVEAGVILIKLWLEVGMEEQDRRFRKGSTTRSGNGNSPRWTSSPIRAGTITRVLAMPCSRRRATPPRRGTPCAATTRRERA